MSRSDCRTPEPPIRRRSKRNNVVCRHQAVTAVAIFQEMKLPKSSWECFGNYSGTTHGDDVIIVKDIGCG
jgi:hypothetical protein